VISECLAKLEDQMVKQACPPRPPKYVDGQRIIDLFRLSDYWNFSEECYNPYFVDDDLQAGSSDRALLENQAGGQQQQQQLDGDSLSTSGN
jgi:hypothetical protein